MMIELPVSYPDSGLFDMLERITGRCFPPVFDSTILNISTNWLDKNNECD